MAASEGYVGPCGGHAETMLGTLGPSRRLLTIIMDHLEAMLKLCSVTSGSVGGFWGLRRAIRRPCWDYVGHLLDLLATILCRLEVYWNHRGELETLLVVFEGYAGAFGAYVGIMLGTLGLPWRHLKALLGHEEAMPRLCCAPWGSLGGSWRLCWTMWSLC